MDILTFKKHWAYGCQLSLLCNVNEKSKWNSWVQPAWVYCSLCLAFLVHQVQTIEPKPWYWSRDYRINSSHVLLSSLINCGQLVSEWRVRAVFTVDNTLPGTEKASRYKYQCSGTARDNCIKSPGFCISIRKKIDVNGQTVLSISVAYHFDWIKSVDKMIIRKEAHFLKNIMTLTELVCLVFFSSRSINWSAIFNLDFWSLSAIRAILNVIRCEKSSQPLHFAMW
jgi:hypothetical protein